MGTEKETGLRIDEFLGVNALVSSEDMQDQFALKTQNLYERRLGELERRGGQSLLNTETPPSRILAANHSFQFQDTMLSSLKCFTGFADSFPIGTLTEANVTMAFVNDATNGRWGTNTTGDILNSFIGCLQIQLVAVGPGLRTKLNTGYATALPVLGDTKKLEVTIAGAGITDKNIRSILVYAMINSSTYAVETSYSYVGYIPVNGTSAVGVYTFTHGPMNINNGTTGTDDNSADPVPVMAVSLGAGSLKAGTYYVALLKQIIETNTAAPAQNRSIYRAWSTVGPTATSIFRVEVLTNNSGIICTFTPGLSGSSSLLAIGTHPHALMPIQLINPATSYTIQSLPDHGIQVRPQRTSAIENEYYFRNADILSNNFITSFGAGEFRHHPINFPPTSILNQFTNASTVLSPFGNNDINGGYYPVWDSIQHISDGRSATFLVFGEEYNVPFIPLQAKQSNLVMFEGNCAHLVRPQYGVTAVPGIPTMKYITNFQGSLVGTDGKLIYFSKTSDPADWSLTGSPSIYNYLQVTPSGEDISGIGVYTNVSGTAGPIGQLIACKPTALFLVSALPFTASGTMIQLSGRVGGLHKTIVNTELGTMLAGTTGVHLLREDGEPSPIGDHIAPLLMPDTAGTIDTTYWHAVYHDNQYKLVYGTDFGSPPNKELWLDIRKMKALKGQPVWNGPHIGRSIHHSCIFDDPISLSKAERFGVNLLGIGANQAYFWMDKYSYLTDLGTSIACILETKDFKPDEPNSNKLYTRTLYLIRADQDLTFTETTTVLAPEGETVEALSMAITKLPTHTGGSFTTFLAARQKLYQKFPTLRLRGESIRKKIEYAGSVYFAISGLTIHFKREGRRVD